MSIYKKTPRAAIAAVAALALSLGAAAYAAAPDTAPPHGGPGLHHHFDGGPFRMMEQLHAKLNLNAQQEKQWQTAVGTMKQNRAEMRKNFGQLRAQFDAQKDKPILDLDAMHTTQQQVEQQNVRLRDQSSAAWLAFYDGLNDQQKTTVSTALKERFAKMEKRHEKMKERWEQHRTESGASSSAQ